MIAASASGRQVSTKVGDFTIDYVHLRNFVQFATRSGDRDRSPSCAEAEAKILGYHGETRRSRRC